MPQAVKKAASYLEDLLEPRSRVLLINPPVHERRYHWLRWNQPAELLRLSSWMKSKAKRVDVRLYDFMFPDENGAVPKHKVKDSWRYSDGQQLWHFGQEFDNFEETIARWLLIEKWRPSVILISSLTSYWHASIQLLITKLCTRLGPKERERTKLCLYGNYPKLEPEHAATQKVDVVFTQTVDTSGHAPDFSLYLDLHSRGPLFYGLDIYDKNLGDQIETCLDIEQVALKHRGIVRPSSVSIAFLNDNIARPGHQWDVVANCVADNPRRIGVEGIVGVEPKSLTPVILSKLKAANIRSLFVEHARTSGGDVDVAAYGPLLDALTYEHRAKQSGQSPSAWLDKAAVTGFVAMGLPDDDMDSLVRSTLYVNKFFQAVILKPFGYSPDIDPATKAERDTRWPHPRAGSPQWFPYADRGGLRRDDYEELIRWQNLLNKRVKGSTFDFLASGTVAKLVRETLVMESWKRHREAR